MTTAPRVSVVIPTYNRAHTLRRAIISVLAQSVSDIELIVIDDASTDHTQEVLRSFSDPRLRSVQHEKRGGAGAARNTGIAASAAPLIAFQDSDDEWLGDKLEQQLRVLGDAPPDVGLVYCRMLRWNGRFATYEPSLRANSGLQGDVSTSILRRNFVSTQTWLVRRSCLDAVGEFDEGLPALEDWEWMIRFSRHFRASFVSAPLAIAYEQHDSISANTDGLISATQAILQKHRSTMNRYGVANFHFLLGARQVMNGDGASGRLNLAKGFLICPAAPRYLLGLLSTVLTRALFTTLWTFVRRYAV